jgi:hypothetical protein
MKIDNDEGFIMVGATYAFDNYGDIWLVKTDSSGSLLWSNNISVHDFDGGASIQLTSDGGYIIGGFTESLGYIEGWGNYLETNFMLVKTDGYGNLKWQKTFAEDRGIAFSAQETFDHGYIIAGSKKVGSDIDYYIVKTDQSGELQWDNYYGGDQSDLASGIIQTSDSGFAITGYSKSYGAGSSDIWLVKTDKSGTKLWDITFGGSNVDDSYRIIEANDNGLVVCGTTLSFGSGKEDFMLIKTDKNGNHEWSKTYGTKEKNETSYNLIQTNDNGFLITGYQYEETREFGNGWLVKTDGFGNRIWSKAFKDSLDNESRAVQQTADGDYIMCGFSYISEDKDYDFKLTKIKN